jgi:hypothetical protein
MGDKDRAISNLREVLKRTNDLEERRKTEQHLKEIEK